MLFKSIALRAAGIALAVSVAANAGLWYAYRGALLDTERVRTEVLAGANARLAESLNHQATAYEERVAELQRRLELSDAVTASALARAEAAADEMRRFRARISAESAEDPTYRAWAETPLPPGVADRLRELQ